MKNNNSPYLLQQNLTLHEIISACIILLISTLTTSCQAQTKHQHVTLEDKIGQMLLIGFRGYEVNEESFIIKDIKAGRIGGVVLFDYDVVNKAFERNIADPEQLTKLIANLKAAAEVPLLVSIDQEGGRVNRLKERYGFPKSVSAQYLGRLNNADSTLFYAKNTAKTLNSLGINLNFAPCVDLNVNPDNPVIGKVERSFSADPEIVTHHASLTIDAHHEYHILTSIKHFPGHGSAWNDSHFGIADVSDHWTENELLPYENLLKAGKVDIVMTAHIFNKNLDEKLPATLSGKVVTGILRERFGYEGVIVSDDMQMNAIDDHYGLEAAVEASINAGIDILVFGNNLDYDPEIATKVKRIILEKIASGEIDEERINESYDRIMTLKSRIN